MTEQDKKYIERLKWENGVLKAALRKIKSEMGRVCPEFEICTHVPCADSFGAWAEADRALREVGG